MSESRTDQDLPIGAAFAEPVGELEEDTFDITAARARAYGRYASGPPRSKVLIISRRGDRESNAVAHELLGRGIGVARLDVDAFGAAARLSFRLGGRQPPAAGPTSGRLDVPAGSLDLEEVGAVWLKRRISELSGIGAPSGPLEAFRHKEIEDTLRGLFGWLAGVPWINRPESLLRMQSKVTQLADAAALGFQTPDTLVTNDPEAARAFFQSHGGQLVVKSFHGEIASGYRDVRRVYSGRIHAANVQLLDRLRAAPAIVQEVVPRTSELRVTVVGERIFAAEITSTQPDPDVDWRRPGHTRYQPIHLSEALAGSCLRLLERWGLRYAAIDFIRTPADQYVFLEANPVGAWCWLEHHTGLAITQAVADLLAASLESPSASLAHAGG